MLKELFVKICEKQGWNVAEFSGGYELSKYSPMGEDFSFFIGENDIKSGVQDYYEDFDPEEHAAKLFNAKRRGVGSVPGSLRNLLDDVLDDADAIDEMLRELANAIDEAKTIVVRAYDIEWDTDGEDIDIQTEFELEVDVSDMEDEEELADYISDYITDKTGWCHNGFHWAIKEEEKAE